MSSSSRVDVTLGRDMRKTLIVSVVLLVVVVGTAVALLREDDLGPIPSVEALRSEGFAVWPQDTLDEAMVACDAAEAWRLDAEQTALQFARDVLRYPEPFVNDVGRTTNSSRYLVNTDGIRGLFLGSLVELRRYDRCWFIVGAEARESAIFPTVSFIHRSDRPHLVLDPVGETRVGYGRWSTEVEARRQVVLRLPDLQSDATGHVMSDSRNARGIVTNIGASPLGFVPDPAAGAVDALGANQIEAIAGICRSGDSFRSPRAAIRDFVEWTLSDQLAIQGGYPTFRRKLVEHLVGDRWLIVADDARLTASVPNLGKRCWRLESLGPPGRQLIRSLHAGGSVATIDLRWGRATEATVILGSARGGDSWALRRISGPVTVFELFSHPSNEPFYVSVVLYRDGHVLSAQHSWYEAT
jgi:hypothetical protein